MKVYIDNMIVKVTTTIDDPSHLQMVFNKECTTCLNPKKCFFMIGREKFLDFMTTQLDIKENPNKKEVQRLNEKLSSPCGEGQAFPKVMERS
ncbi:hypothetical protein VIGAN_09068400 [Vigna angularis var. angularis]|uniref:Reverse transcriptase Ty1/copia-type domain-containing protein n=1 Tax=Vigna angularis var. angularis TaxID=157739 RepID=A0A0S3SWN2_PHAAN|nr:hypothetical protein VIGAN_09068400 [Vigna angularis var. angularis]